MTRFAPLIAVALVACTPEVIVHGAPDGGSCETPDACVPPSQRHPRLWLTSADLPALRARAVSSNAVFAAGLSALALRGIELMDTPPAGSAGNRLPGEDTGSSEWTPVITESWAQLFALLSLVDPDPAKRDDYGSRAKRLFMHVIEGALPGPGDGPYRSEHFMFGERAGSTIEALPITADWIHDRLSAEDLRKVRRVFLRWSQEITRAAESPYPTVASRTLTNDTQLLGDLGTKRMHLRRSLEAPYVRNMRNIGLFSLALDDADDVDDPNLPGDDAGALAAFRAQAIGAWLYVFDELLRTDSAGGVPAVGLWNVNRSLGAGLEFLLALETAGNADDAGVAKWGRQVRVAGHPFWDKVPAAYLSSLPNTPKAVPDLGVVFQPASFGKRLDYYAEDPMRAFGPLGILAARSGDTSTADAARWIERNIPPGGANRLSQRLGDASNLLTAILGFLLYDPASSPPADPRPALPTVFSAPAIGRVVARTSWEADARLVSFRLGWVSSEQQNGDGGMFDFNRKGTWLTKERTGTGFIAAGSDYKNAITIQTPAADATELGVQSGLLARRGSQFGGGAASDPPAIVTSSGDGDVFFSGDAAALYAYDTGGRVQITAVEEARRAIAWLKPDHLVVFDRVETTESGRPTRFWLTLPGEATLEGARVRSAAPDGQQLFVTTLLPEGAGALRDIVETDPEIDTLDMEYSFAAYDPMDFPYSFPGQSPVHGARRLRIEAGDHAAKTVFLHVLEGADASATPAPVPLLRSDTGTPFVGVMLPGSVVLFRESNGPAFAETSFVVPNGPRRYIVAGLTAGANVAVEQVAGASTTRITLRNGGDLTVDAAGVLRF